MTYIETLYSKKIDFWEPDPNQITLADIANALSNTPRFSGHTTRFYSVAEHSIMVSRCVPPHLKLQALLHDATEAYLTDMPTPFKRLMPQYQEAEWRIWLAICKKFDLPEELDPLVKQADKMCLLTERDTLQSPRSWGPEYDNYPRAGAIYRRPEGTGNEHVRSDFMAQVIHELKMKEASNRTSSSARCVLGT